MSGEIEFTDDYGENYSTYEGGPNGITEKVIFFSRGIIKTKKQAEIVLIIFVILVVGLSFSIFKKSKEKPIAGAFPVPPQENFDF